MLDKYFQNLHSIDSIGYFKSNKSLALFQKEHFIVISRFVATIHFSIRLWETFEIITDSIQSDNSELVVMVTDTNTHTHIHTHTHTHTHTHIHIYIYIYIYIHEYIYT